jgi:chromosome segregation ATPase
MDNHQQQQMMNEAARQFTDALVTTNKATADRTVEAQQLGAQLTEYFFNTVINNLRTQAEGARQVTQQLANQQQRTQEATRQLTRGSVDTYKDLLDSMFFFYQGGTSRAKIRTEEAERRAEDAERRVEEAEANAQEANRRAERADKGVEQAEKSTGEAKRRAEKAAKGTEEAEKRAQEAEGRVEEAERGNEEAQRRAKEAERRAQEAESRTEEAQRRDDEAGRVSSEASSQGGDDLPLADYDSLNVRQISERLDGLNAEEIERLRNYEARNKDRSTLVNRFNSRLEASSQ